MAQSTCIKCGSTRFETKEVTPSDSNFILMFIQCSSCGGVVGVMDLFNIGNLIHELANNLGVPLN